MSAPVLCTIGYQGASLDQFIARLCENDVRILVDVRHTPYSRRPEFIHTRLKAALVEAEISVIHLKPLGNPPEIRNLAQSGGLDAYAAPFRDHLRMPEPSKALGQVLEVLESGPACLMCLERSPSDCHRSLVAEALAAMAPMTIQHLVPGAPVSSAQLTLL